MDRSVPYGVKAIRHLKKSHVKNASVRPCLKREQVIEKTYDYFLREVDPVIGECITHLLCTRPPSVAAAMYEYLQQKRNGVTPIATPSAPQKTSKAHRLFLATQISPVLTKLVNRIATSRPNNVIEFMCLELEQLMKNQSEVPSGAKSVLVASSLPPPPKSIQIILLGIQNAGKTAFVNSLQGTFDNPKPTIGFRPTTMMMGADKVKFYDLGGGPKIRDIWAQYYHDVHAIIYVVDSTITEGEAAEESVSMFHKTMAAEFLAGKTVLLLANKQDLPGALNASGIASLYGVASYSNIQVAEVSCNPYASAEESPEVELVHRADDRIEPALEWLLGSVQRNYEAINSKVVADTKHRQALDDKLRLERERRVLRNKILCAFPSQVNPAMLTADSPSTPEDVFDREEAIAFVAAEVGVEVASLPAEAIEVVELVGYQRLAMQMVSALHAPISKKKTPMSWADIKTVVVALRAELGLPETL